MLTNAILGHPDVKDRLMVPGDVPGIISAGTVSKASIYNNLFGGNLTDTIPRQFGRISYGQISPGCVSTTAGKSNSRDIGLRNRRSEKNDCKGTLLRALPGKQFLAGTGG
jgi:hypothetical protein